jgi:hypothetical protein
LLVVLDLHVWVDGGSGSFIHPLPPHLHSPCFSPSKRRHLHLCDFPCEFPFTSFASSFYFPSLQQQPATFLVLLLFFTESPLSSVTPFFTLLTFFRCVCVCCSGLPLLCLYWCALLLSF